MKTCCTCKQQKPLSEFTVLSSQAKRAGRISSSCKICRSDYEKKWVKEHYITAQHRWNRYYKKHLVDVKNRARKQKETLRNAALARYGTSCVCCGEDVTEFLTIDHIFPPTKKTARERKDLYGWLKKHAYPDGFQTLCWNCNMSKHQHGQCPHMRSRTIEKIKGVTDNVLPV